MKYISWLSTVLVISVLMTSCSSGQQQSSEGSVAENVDVETFEKLVGKAQIVDVRTPPEWKQGVIEGAVLNDIYSDDFEQKLEQLDKNRPVGVYCKVGGRSSEAMSIMKKRGFKEVYNLNGGMDAWKRAGKPVVEPEL